MMKNPISLLKNFISSLVPPACYRFCYREMEDKGYAVFGMCSGVINNEQDNTYAPCTCVDCPYLIKTLKEE